MEILSYNPILFAEQVSNEAVIKIFGNFSESYVFNINFPYEIFLDYR